MTLPLVLPHGLITPAGQAGQTCRLPEAASRATRLACFRGAAAANVPEACRRTFAFLVAGKPVTVTVMMLGTTTFVFVSGTMMRRPQLHRKKLKTFFDSNLISEPPLTSTGSRHSCIPRNWWNNVNYPHQPATTSKPFQISQGSQSIGGTYHVGAAVQAVFVGKVLSWTSLTAGAAAASPKWANPPNRANATRTTEKTPVLCMVFALWKRECRDGDE